MIVGARDKSTENEQKNQIFQKKMQNYNSMIGRRGVLNQKSRGLFDRATGSGTPSVGGGSDMNQWLTDEGHSKYRGRWTSDAVKAWQSHKKEIGDEKWGASEEIMNFAQINNLPMNTKEDLTMARNIYLSAQKKEASLTKMEEEDTKEENKKKTWRDYQ